MICDLHEISAVRPIAEIRAQSMGLRRRISILDKAAILVPSRANLYRKTSAMTQFEIAALEHEN